MAKVDVWMPLYIGDYLADTSRLTTEQHGAYLLLIMDYWRNGPPPDNDAVLSQICRMSPDAWSNARSTIRAFFEHVDGHLRHPRIDKELAKAKEDQAKREEKARLAAEKRWGKVTTNIDATSNAWSNAWSNEQAMLEQCPSPSPSPSPCAPKGAIETEAAPDTSLAAAIFKTLKSASITNINQSNPKFIALIEAGATHEEFKHAVFQAVKNNARSFNYVISVVAGERERVANLKLHKGPMPNVTKNSVASEREAVSMALTGRGQARPVIVERDITAEVHRVA